MACEAIHLGGINRTGSGVTSRRALGKRDWGAIPGVKTPRIPINCRFTTG